MTSHLNSDFIVVAKMGATHGVNGWLKIESYTQNPSDVFLYSPWYHQSHSGEFEIFPLESHLERPQGFLIKIQNINAPELAKSYTGKFIYIQHTQLNSLDHQSYYWVDLIGCRVFDQNHQDLGIVESLSETPAHDNLHVNFHGKIHLVPFRIPEVVTSVDIHKKEIHVDWERL